jgi:hypothetical protein
VTAYEIPRILRAVPGIDGAWSGIAGGERAKRRRDKDIWVIRIYTPYSLLNIYII